MSVSNPDPSNTNQHTPATENARNEQEQQVIHTLLQALRRVRYGSISLIIQDGRVVQIDILEKTRLTERGELAR